MRRLFRSFVLADAFVPHRVEAPLAERGGGVHLDDDSAARAVDRTKRRSALSRSAQRIAQTAIPSADTLRGGLPPATAMAMIDRHYGHLARDGREHAIRLLGRTPPPGRSTSTPWT